MRGWAGQVRTDGGAGGRGAGTAGVGEASWKQWVGREPQESIRVGVTAQAEARRQDRGLI